MLFHEIYGVYYNTVAKILKAAVAGGVTTQQIHELVEKYAYSESVLIIEPAIKQQRWQLIRSDGTTPLQNSPTMPLTELQQRWFKAISLDPRIRLFGCEIDLPDDIDPLFTAEDFCIFDQYSDGDNYTDPEYIAIFRRLLQAVREQRAVYIEMYSRRGELNQVRVLPRYIEYSEKDDKFRLIADGTRYKSILNIGRIISCEFSSEAVSPLQREFCSDSSVTMELIDERNTLERAMLHFSHFRKEAVKLSERRYRLTIYYAKEDATEIVIRILSFGPTVRVMAPDSFIRLIKERLKKQKDCGQ